MICLFRNEGLFTSTCKLSTRKVLSDSIDIRKSSCVIVLTKWKTNIPHCQNRKGFIMLLLMHNPFVDIRVITYVQLKTVTKFNGNIAEKGKMDTPNIHIHNRSLFWLGTGTSMTM